MIHRYDLILISGLAVQDQEIAKGVRWVNDSRPSSVKWLWDAINDVKIEKLREADPEALAVICALACIGMFEVMKAREAAEPGRPTEEK